jgi:hypothetical protein
MSRRAAPWVILSAALLAAILAACAAASAEEPATIVETVVVTVEREGETVVRVVTATPEPAPPTPTPVRIYIEITATPGPAIIEPRQVALEWSPAMEQGESAVVVLAFNPDTGQISATLQPTSLPAAEEPAESGVITDTQIIEVKHIPEYDVRAAAALDGVGFAISPAGEQVRLVTPGEPLEWRWTITPSRTGTQRLNVVLAMRWSPRGDPDTLAREAVLYSRTLRVDVAAPPANTGRMLGMGALTLGGAAILGWSVSRWVRLRPPARRRLPFRLAAPRRAQPNPHLSIEPHPDIHLAAQERALLASVFHRYGRVVIEQEFKSGYSGARALLAQPLHPDGRADAHTIVKLGGRAAILRERENYARFVADTLPPVTARIQHPPVAQRDLAALRYTFVAEPGRTPQSLRAVLLHRADPRLLWRLFETFGPNWWMQRHPYTFRLAQEYDRKLPAHLTLEPVGGPGRPLPADTPPADLRVNPGDLLVPTGFAALEPHGGAHTLWGQPSPGNPALRLRWLGAPPRPGQAGRVAATRQSVLRDLTAGFDRFTLPDPLERLPALLHETVRGSRAIIHGDLNLENALVGPGGMVWLIDFAMTREGHTLYDFAHLHAEIIAHVLAPQIDHPRAYVEVLRDHADPLLRAIHDIAVRCLFDHTSLREYDLALAVSCLGALKFANLDAHARHLLYLTAAWVLADW